MEDFSTLPLSLVAIILFMLVDPTLGVNQQQTLNLKPIIASNFHAKVSVSMVEGDVRGNAPSWRGGGIFALDMDSGISRTDIRLEGLRVGQKPIHLHALDRYDRESTFIIDELARSDETTSRCTQRTVTGKPEHPFAWVSKAEYTGLSQYLGMSLENWEYFDTSAKMKMKLSVKRHSNTPVFFSTRHASNFSVSEWSMTFMEWNEARMPAWMTYIPQSCWFAGKNSAPTDLRDNAGVVYFANKNWNCADVACSSTVPAGSGQPGYACAEFSARSLCYGGYIPGVGAYDPQGSYYSYSYGGTTYDLCLTTSMSDALGALGFTKLAAQASSVTAGVAVFGDGGDGYFSHAVIGVGPQTVDAHNNARYNIAVTDDLFQGIDACWGPPGSPSSSGTSSGTATSSTSGYTSGFMKDPADVAPAGGNGIYDVKASSERISAGTESKDIFRIELNDMPQGDHLRVREERAPSKFFA